MSRRYFILVFLLTLATPAIAGHESNGGNYVTANFTTWGQNVQGFLSNQAPNQHGPILNDAQLTTFTNGVDVTRVELVTTSPFLDINGFPVHARVVPDELIPGQKKIQLDNEFWKDAVGSNPATCRLVFHEYLRIAGISDEQSAVSHQFQSPCDFFVNAGAVNLGFENSSALGAMPDGWELSGGGYLVGADNYTTHRGVWSGKINPAANGGSFGALTQCIDATPYRGRTLRLFGYLRTHAVSMGYGGLWLRVDDHMGRILAFDNMNQRGLHGSTPWTLNVVELPVTEAATRICFGALLNGYGALWVDDLELSSY